MTTEHDAEILDLLREMCRWMRIGFRPQTQKALTEALDTSAKRRAYQMTDGLATRETIRKECAMSPNSLLQLWRDCVEVGLMEELPDGRRRRLFDLKSFGLMGTEDID